MINTPHHPAVESDVQKSALYLSDACLVEALRGGDERAFAWLLDQYHASMLRLALIYVSNRAVAEEAVQETWLGVLQGLDRFEARSSLKTWIFSILTNCAKKRGQREGRSVSFSSLGASLGSLLDNLGEELVGPSVDLSRFRQNDPWRNHWASFPRSWGKTPEECVLSAETRVYIEEAIKALPPNQRAVITLHDIDGLSPEEICNVLGITETNQRVLLHRARSRVRQAIEQYMDREQL